MHKFQGSEICAEENLPSEQMDVKQLSPTKVVLFVLTPVHQNASADSTYVHLC